MNRTTDVLAATFDKYSVGEITLTTTFQASGMMLIDLIYRHLAKRPDVLFVDTLYHFPETLEHAERVRQHYDLSLRTIRAYPDRQAFEREYGQRLWERDLDTFYQVLKVRPLEKALAPYQVWLNARRRDQAPTRESIPTYEHTGDLLKVNPLAGWTHEQVWGYILQNDIPYNPLHDRGYSSIGEQPLTSTPCASDRERAGRWPGQNRWECGIHTKIR
nr:phosphoadenylyl-sulfate reductase [Halorhodospira halochloris]